MSLDSLAMCLVPSPWRQGVFAFPCHSSRGCGPSKVGMPHVTAGVVHNGSFLADAELKFTSVWIRTCTDIVTPIGIVLNIAAL